MPHETITGTVKVGYLKGAADQAAYDAGSPIIFQGSELTIIGGAQNQDIFIPDNGVLVKERRKRQQIDYGLQIKTNRLVADALQLYLFGDAGTGDADYDEIEPMKGANANAEGIAVITVIDDDAVKPAIKISYQRINPAPEGNISITPSGPGEVTIDLNPLTPFVSVMRRKTS